MIVLTHPVHGTKHAYLEAEAVADEKNGWVRAKPVEVPSEAAFVEAGRKLDEAGGEFKRKPGRPKKVIA